MDDYLNSLDDNKLKSFTRQAVEDLTVAANVEPISEWHGACFAAALLASDEMCKRGIKAVTVHQHTTKALVSGCRGAGQGAVSVANVGGERQGAAQRGRRGRVKAK